MPREQIPGQRQIPHLATKKKTIKRSPKKSAFLKVLLYIGIVILLLIPTYLAISHYIYQKNNVRPVVETYHTSVEIVGPSGFVLSARSGEQQNGYDLLSCFEKMIADRISLPQVPDSHQKAYQITLHTNTGDSERYTFYFSPSTSIAYFTDAAGKNWRASETYSAEFLNSPHAFEIYPQSAPPVLTSEKTDIIIPTALSWSYRAQNDFADLLYRETTTDESIVYPIVNDISFDFSLEPSSCTVVILNTSGEKIYEGSYENIFLPQLVQDQLLTFEIHASYNPKSNVDYSGEVTYKFRMRVVEAASFTPDTTTPTAGGFVIVTCHNVRNEEKIEFSATPALVGTPVLFSEGDKVYAMIPTATAGAQELTITYGTVKSVIDLVVGAPSTNVCTIPAEELRGDWNAALSGGIANLIEIHGISTTDTTLTATQFAAFGGTAKFSFGDTLVVGDQINTTSPLSLYEVSGAISASALGEVVVIGENDLLGKFVVIDHGRGIRTWYAGLSHIDAAVGDILDAGDTFALAGDCGIGLADTDSVVVFATLGKVAISTAYLEQYDFDLS